MRLGLSQDEFAAVGGVLRRAQSNYESDERSPDVKYLTAVAELGVDVTYILLGRRGGTGEQGADAQPIDEQELLESYRQLNEAGKAALQAFVASCISTGSMLQNTTPRRAKRLPENRRAALDQRAAENVERAMAEIERLRAERATKDAKK
ncbi:XRE family transcriptional regulator [Burkholderia ubonensis]|nr:XRE family transcriptional regulator [Burkholderia ubonensis]KVS41076.1 XRE family transcriptional regulator [Burkholderia ubonensis]KVS53236.1 XRE family transcriptional regulator [Burkholderia ubonensis]KVS71431.1 XRE family transcriptional regulator [Burkholderia ubonensis]KVS83504.1 XRE family transcriptional regulator [Burkholderia ubonensis]